jgi:hypothetical protein
MDIKNGIIYLVQPAELVGVTNRYKIGMSNKQGLKRCLSYKTGTRYLCIMEQTNVYELEKKIKQVFNAKFKLVAGHETFEGNEKEIKNTFISLIKQHENEQNFFNKKINLHKKNKQKEEIINNNQTEKIEQKEEIINNNQTEKIKQKEEIINNNQTEKIKQNTNNKNCICKNCNKTYGTESGLWKHNKIYHNKNKPVESKEDKVYTCAYCNKHFDYYQSRWRHEKSCKLLLKKPLLVKYNELSLELLNLYEKNNKNKNVEIEL